MGSTLVGGGYQLMGSTPLKSSPSGGTNSPDASYPSGGTWYVKAGGYPDFCFRAFAMCVERQTDNPAVGSILIRLVPQSLVTGFGGMYKAHGALRLRLDLVAEDHRPAEPRLGKECAPMCQVRVLPYLL